MMRRTCIVFAFCFGVVYSSRVAAADGSLDKVVESLVSPFIENELIVGCSIALLKGDEVAKYHFGQVAENSAVANDETIYEIGSVSKVFTALLLADAANRGLVTISQAAQELLPEKTRWPEERGGPVRLVDLATHRSGFPSLPSNLQLNNADNPYAKYTSRELLEFLGKYQFKRSLGKYEYSNLGFATLGYLLCVKTGMTYEELLSQRITQPLGMRDTSTVVSVEEAKRMAAPNATVGIPNGRWTFADLPGAGGICSTLPDLIAFCKANMDPPSTDVGAAIELAWKEHATSEKGSPSMGLGWHITMDDKVHWHNGQTGGSHSIVLIQREPKLAVIVLANTATLQLDQLGRDLMLVLAGKQVQPQKFRAVVKVPNDVKQRYVGQYDFVPGVRLTVSLQNNRLMAMLSGQQALPLYAASETKWFYRAVEAEVEFKVDADNQPIAIELLQGGIRQVAKRVAAK